MHGAIKALTMAACLLPGTMARAASPVIEVTNPTRDDWKEAPVVVTWTPSLQAAWDRGERILTSDKPVAFQCDDLDGDGRIDEMVFLADLAANDTRTYRLGSQGQAPDAPKRVDAVMSLKGFDGPGWESDLIAYRIYWNADNAIDIFGKTRPRLSLQGWATPGVPHNIENEFGIDVLKIGRSIGLGGFAAYIDGRVEKISNVMKTYHIRADGPIRAVVELEYVNWQPGRIPDLSHEAITSLEANRYDLKAYMSIFAGQKWAEADVRIKPIGDAPIPQMVTGVPIHDETVLIEDPDAGILGRWGNQALGDGGAPKAGNLGIGVIVDPRSVVAYGQTDYDNIVRLRPRDGRVVYRYHGSWFKEPGAAESAADYERMLRDVARLRPQVKVTTE